MKKNNSYQPYTMDHIRHIGFQLVKAVKCEFAIDLSILLCNFKLTFDMFVKQNKNCNTGNIQMLR